MPVEQKSFKRSITFIVGAGHSGSTLLAKALNAHSKIFSLSEICNFEEEMDKDFSLCGCGEAIKKCKFWTELNKMLRQKLGFGIMDCPNEFRISRETSRNNLYAKVKFRLERFIALNTRFYSPHIKRRIRNIDLLFDCVFEKTNSEILVDSSKSAKRASLLNVLLKHKYDIKVIHLVRDGRAVLYSYLKGYYTIKMKDSLAGKEKMVTYHANKEDIRNKKEIVRIWKRDNRMAEFYHKWLNNKNYYFLRYEDLAENPKKELKALLSFLGLAYEEEMPDLNRFENHMVSGNASRINASRIEEPFNKWKSNLKAEEIQYFYSRAQNLNRKFGYKS